MARLGRTACGTFDLKGIDNANFVGWLRALNVCGLDAVEAGSSANFIDITRINARRDGADHYGVMIHIRGELIVKHNDQTTKVNAGGIALIDRRKPVTYLLEGCGQWLGIKLSREKLRSHMGFEPRSGVCKPGDALSSRLFMQLVRETIHERELSALPAEPEPFMQSVLYDLVSAMFGMPDPSLRSSHSEKLFARACAVIRARFTEPEISVSDVAAEMGIQTRYLQKLFAARGTTYTNYIRSLRLERAADLLKCRAALRTGQPLSEIAFACGFNDYKYFYRSFRRHFGCVPSGIANAEAPRSVGDLN